jgi:hypothetical protein
VARVADFLRSIFRSTELHYTDAEILFLATFLYPRPVRDRLYAIETDWLSVLVSTPDQTVRRFIDDGLVRRASQNETLLSMVPAAKIIAYADALGLSTDETVSKLADSVLAKISPRSRLYTWLAQANCYRCTHLGEEITTAFIARSGIEHERVDFYRPPARFVAQVRTAVKWFLVTAAGGVIGNRTDALFVYLQQAKLRGDANLDSHGGTSPEQPASAASGESRDHASPSHAVPNRSTGGKARGTRHEQQRDVMPPPPSQQRDPHQSHTVHGHGTVDHGADLVDNILHHIESSLHH